MISISSLCALAAIPAFFLVHIAVYRIFEPRISRQKAVILIVAAVCSLAAVAAWVQSGEPQQGVHAYIVSTLFGMIYFHWFNMSETARRIRILVRFVALGEAPAESVNDGARRIFANRMIRMSELGTIKAENGKYKLIPGPLLYATRLILFWRSIFFPKN